jgi:hypothetical protein
VTAISKKEVVMAKRLTRRKTLKATSTVAAFGLLAPSLARANAAAAPTSQDSAATGGARLSEDTLKGANVDKKTLVAYCGIYCGLCDRRTRVPDRAAALKAAMEKAEYDAPEEFQQHLAGLAEVSDDKCCRTGKCGAPFCAVRKCAKAKGVEICTDCDEYPCDRMKLFGECEPLLLADGQRILKYGLDKWIEEQEKRRGDGFCYADIRCYPYYFPSK